MVHKCRRLIIVLLVVSLLLVNGSLAGLAQAPDLYTGTWRTGIGIKNLDTVNDDNTIDILFYDADTGTPQSYHYADTLAAGAGIEVYLPNIPDAQLSSGSYSVEVQSTGPVGVMATNTNYDANMADSYNGVTSATEFFVPGIYNNHNSWTSNLMVQNVGATAINVSIEVAGINLVTQAAVGPVTFGPVNIPARATRSFDTGTNSPINFDAQLGDSFLGSAKVTNTESQDMAVVLFNTRVSGSSQVVLSYRGLTGAEDAGTFLAAPIIYKNFNNGWRSGITVQNVDDTNPVEVRLTVTSDPAIPAFTATATHTIQPGKSFEWYLPNAGIFDGGVTVPDNFLGSGKVEVISGDGKILGTVVTTNYVRPKTLKTPPPGVGVALGYVMPSGASGREVLSAPTVYKNFGTGIWNSSLIVSNVGTASATFSLTLASDPDSPATYNKTISGFSLAAGESKEFYLPNATHLDGNVVPNGFKGSILVSGSTDAKLSGIVQHTNYGRGVATVYLAAGG